MNRNELIVRIQNLVCEFTGKDPSPFLVILVGATPEQDYLGGNLKPAEAVEALEAATAAMRVLTASGPLH